MRAYNKYLEWLNNALFSFYAGLLVAGIEGLKEGSRLLNLLEAPVAFYDSLVHRKLTHHEPHLWFGAVFVASMGILIIFCALSLAPQLQRFLGALPACAAIASPFYYRGLTIFNADGTFPSGLATNSELLLAAVLTMFLLRRPQWQPSWMITISVIHFAFWRVVIFGVYGNPYVWQQASLVLLPFCIVAIWALYVKANDVTDRRAPPLS